MDYLELQMAGMKKEKLAEWGDIFNSWEWPDDFITTKPSDWDNLSLWDNEDKTSRTKYLVSKPYTNAIRNIIGEKECLRYHHIHNLKMKNYQFEIWWFIDTFMQKYFNKNFYLDFYDFIGWRDTK